MEEEIACTGFFRAAQPDTISCLDAFEDRGAWQFVTGNLLEAPYNLVDALTNPSAWLGWIGHASMRDRIGDLDAAQSLMRFIYYGASYELFFIVLWVFLIVTVIGLISNRFMWACVRGLEGFANAVGRFFAWAGLIMVFQQILVIFMQGVFAVSKISLGFGASLTKDVSWWSEELKLYNAMIVCLCATYTFVQGGHVRVDLVYSGVSYRAKRMIDMFGSIVFMLPAAVLTWLFGWFFMWRSLVTPPTSASDGLERLLTKARALKWNVETVGFSPNGFDLYILFKILLLSFVAMVMLQAVAFFYRSYLELREGPASEGRYLDRDQTGDATADLVADIH